MSSDGYFDDDIDDNMLQQLDAIEAAHFSPQKRPSPRPLTRRKSSFDDYDLTFDIDDSELRRLDDFIEDAYQGKAGPVAGPSRPTKNTVQTTLFGDILPNAAPRSRTQSNTSNARTQAQPTTARNPFGQQAAKTKVWDHTAFAKTGLRSGKSKGKGRSSFNGDDDEHVEEEEVEFEQFPAPFVSGEL
jgi:ATP-dependent DNA helicase MPH1